MTNREETGFFVRNEGGQGFRPTRRGQKLLLVWDVASWIVFAAVVAAFIARVSIPWWAFVLIIPFAAGPLLAMMFFTGKGPIGALLHYGRNRGRQS